MSDRPEKGASQGSDRPLFENMDEMEREYAPEEVPGDERAAVETDRGGTAGMNIAGTGTEGDQERREPVFPIPQASGINVPISGVPPEPAPAASDERSEGEDDTAASP